MAPSVKAVKAGLRGGLRQAPRRLRLEASARRKDNIWAALRGDLNERITDRFTRCLPPPSPDVPASQAQRGSVASELERLVGLRDQRILSADEFEAAKAKVLGS